MSGQPSPTPAPKQVNWILPMPRHQWAPPPQSGNTVALDCEMIEVRPPPGSTKKGESRLAHVAIVSLILDDIFTNQDRPSNCSTCCSHIALPVVVISICNN